MRVGHELSLAVGGLAVGYGGPPVLTEVTFAAAPGERIAVLGPNGGGKTTLFRALTGELSPAAGTLELGGRAGVVPQTDRSRLDYPVSALDVVLMGLVAGRRLGRPRRADRALALDALESTGMRERAGVTFGELSGGQRQRVLVARALVQDARVVLFDEPFTGLDAPSAAQLDELIDRLAAEGRTLLIATHDVGQALAWDQVLCLNRRQVAFGPPATTLTPAVVEATYGTAVVRLPGAGAPLALVHHHGHDHG